MRNLVYNNPVTRAAQPSPLYSQPAPMKTIPFDYVFQLALKGERGNKAQDVVEISAEGAFVALSIGYSLVPDERKISRSFQPQFNQETTPRNPVIVPLYAFINNEVGDLDGILVAGTPDAEIMMVDLNSDGCGPFLPRNLLPKTERIGPDGTVTINLPSSFSFGAFRIWDITNNLLSEVFILLEFSANAMIGPNSAKKLPAAGDDTVFVYGFPEEEVNIYLFENTSKKIFRVIREIENNGTSIFFPLDKNTTFDKVTGRAVVPLKIREGGSPIINKKLSFGDMLLVNNVGTEQFSLGTSTFTIPHPRPSTITLGALAAGLEKIGADLFGGFRLNPDLANVLSADVSLAQLSSDTLNRVFETGSFAADEISFLYSLDVSSSGREYQNRAIHNIAGLGIADGGRPFRTFAKPTTFEPRTSIRIQVEERSGPAGTLNIVLQGYKILGSGTFRP